MIALSDGTLCGSFVLEKMSSNKNQLNKMMAVKFHSAMDAQMM